MGDAAMNDVKTALREERWRGIRDAGAARFPGVRGRIPNFVGAEAAARALAETDVFRDARVLKCNPDSPQRPVRHAALKAGKTVLMAVPKLAERKCFLRLDPAELESLWHASSIKGASEVGVPVEESEVGAVDLIVTGCVAVGRDGARLGKGGGYSDLEYALLRELGLVDAHTPIVSTVHSSQLVPKGAVPMAPHDISLDWVATEQGALQLERTHERPGGVVWELLDETKVKSIPALAARRA